MLVVMACQVRKDGRPFMPVAIVITGVMACGLIAMMTKNWLVGIGAFPVLFYLGGRAKIFQSWQVEPGRRSAPAGRHDMDS